MAANWRKDLDRIAKKYGVVAEGNWRNTLRAISASPVKSNWRKDLAVLAKKDYIDGNWRNDLRAFISNKAVGNWRNDLEDTTSTNLFNFDIPRELACGTYSLLENGFLATGAISEIETAAVWSKGWLLIRQPLAVGSIVLFEYEILAINDSRVNRIALIGRTADDKHAINVGANVVVGQKGTLSITVTSPDIAMWLIALSSMTVKITNIFVRPDAAL